MKIKTLMKQPKRKPTKKDTFEAEKKKAAERAAKIAHALARCGEATKQHFSSAIKKATGCEFQEAQAAFDSMLHRGEIHKTRANEAGDVEFYAFEK